MTTLPPSLLSTFEFLDLHVLVPAALALVVERHPDVPLAGHVLQRPLELVLRAVRVEPGLVPLVHVRVDYLLAIEADLYERTLGDHLDMVPLAGRLDHLSR